VDISDGRVFVKKSKSLHLIIERSTSLKKIIVGERGTLADIARVACRLTNIEVIVGRKALPAKDSGNILFRRFCLI